jgi:transposase
VIYIKKTFRQEGNKMSPFEKLILEALSQDLRPEHRRRLEIIVRTEMGQSQAEICAALGCSPETARYWMTIAKTEQALDCYNRPIGRPKIISDRYLERLKELVTQDPEYYGYSFGCWTAQRLGEHLANELGIEVSICHINRLLKQMGLSTHNRKKTSLGKPESHSKQL